MFVANAVARLQTQGSLTYADDRLGYEVPVASLRALARGIRVKGATAKEDGEAVRGRNEETVSLD
jgi:hypothetical protein